MTGLLVALGGVLVAAEPRQRIRRRAEKQSCPTSSATTAVRGDLLSRRRVVVDPAALLGAAGRRRGARRLGGRAPDARPRRVSRLARSIWFAMSTTAPAPHPSRSRPSHWRADGPHARRTAAAARRPAAARALHEARPAAVLQPPRLPAGVRTGVAPRRRTHGLLRGLLAAPQGLLRGRGARPGTASEAEYLEIALAQRCEPDRLREALDESLPPDLDVLEVVEVATHGAPSLAERLQASVWQMRLTGCGVRRRGPRGGCLPGHRARGGVADDQERAAHLRCAGPRSSRWRCRTRSAAGLSVREI